MKRYLLFAGSNYYPAGGWDDFWAASDDIEELKRQAENGGWLPDWAHIVDLETREVICRDITESK